MGVDADGRFCRISATLETALEVIVEVALTTAIASPSKLHLPKLHNVIFFGGPLKQIYVIIYRYFKAFQFLNLPE